MPKHDATRQLLPDYLDGNLSRRTRSRVEKHLRFCPDCRNELAMQQAWLQRRQTLLQQDRPEPPDNLNARIMSAIRAAAGAAGRHEPAARHWTRMVPGLAGAAAAILLLVFAFRIYPGLSREATGTTGSDIKGLIPSEPTSAQAAYQENSSRQAASSASKDLTVDTVSGWQVVSGSPQVLERTDTLFANKAASGVSAQSALAAILDQATDLRFLQTVGPPARTLILAAYPADQIDRQADLVKQALTTCQNPIKIEIIRADDLPDRLNGLDAGLFNEAFVKTPAESSWIFILMGE